MSIRGSFSASLQYRFIDTENITAGSPGSRGFADAGSSVKNKQD